MLSYHCHLHYLVQIEQDCHPKQQPWTGSW